MTLRYTFEQRQARDAYRKSVRDNRSPKVRIDKDPVKLGGEAVIVPPRPKLTAAQRRHVLDKHDGHCARLECTETRGLEIDHIIPRDLGGADHVDNYEPLCEPHHKAKTARDIKLIAKARRIRKGLTEPRQPSRIQSAPFSDDYQPLPPSRGFRS